MKKRKLNKFQLFEGMNILFHIGLQDTIQQAKINDCIYNMDDLEQISDFFWDLLGKNRYNELRKKEFNK